LRELVSLLRKSDEEAEALLASVLEREKSMSTGIGRGIAIPHGKSPRARGLELAFGISSEPIDYASLDRKPVRLFFLLVSPLTKRPHTAKRWAPSPGSWRLTRRTTSCWRPRAPATCCRS
jgi:mannitol/fructose-specific phosphotransferase system IIA component (Ntr-type)